MSRADVSEMRTLPLASLVPDPQNAKEHTDTQIEHMCSSITEFGFNDPIGVMEQSDGTYLIVEGHGRSLAAGKLGMAEVPCLILPAMSVKERKAYAIAHNQIQTITGLDMGIVAEEFNRLSVSEEDYASTGFTTEDVLFLLPDATDTPDGEMAQADSDNEEGYNSNSWKGFIPPVYKSNLRFDNEGDKLSFYQFVNVLRGKYLTAATIAERFVLFIQEHAPELADQMDTATDADNGDTDVDF